MKPWTPLCVICLLWSTIHTDHVIHEVITIECRRDYNKAKTTQQEKTALRKIGYLKFELSDWVNSQWLNPYSLLLFGKWFLSTHRRARIMWMKHLPRYKWIVESGIISRCCFCFKSHSCKGLNPLLLWHNIRFSVENGWKTKVKRLLERHADEQRQRHSMLRHPPI